MQSRALVVSTALAAALVSGGWLLQRGFHGGRGAADGARLFEDVAAHIRRYYVDSIADSTLERKAVDGVLLELHDPHSVYLDARRLDRLSESTTGRYAGIGIQMDVRDGFVVVIAPLPGTPAERVGLATGDRIVSIDGRTTEKWTTDEALRALRGSAGTSVRLDVDRPGMDSRLHFTVRREEIQFHAVQHAVLLGDGIGYVDLTNFSESASDDLRRAIDSLRQQGMTRLVLDLRGNPGGLLEAGVAVSELFLDPGQKIVSMRGRSPDANREYTDESPQPFATLPMVVLQDSASASAAEIVAGALQDHDRAAIVGTASYGKGSAQSLYRMGDGGALKLTTALWYTPSGRSINRPRTVRDETSTESPSSFTVDTTESPRPFRTAMGRRISGGGGIHPDVLVAQRALSDADLEFERALGTGIPRFRDALVSYALQVKGRGEVTTPLFYVTPEMRDELYRQMRARGLEVDSLTYSRASQTVDRLLGRTIAQYVFGRRGEAIRAARDDSAVVKAIELLRGASSPSDVIARTTAPR